MLPGSSALIWLFNQRTLLFHNEHGKHLNHFLNGVHYFWPQPKDHIKRSSVEFALCNLLGLNMWNMLRCAYSLQRFKQWTDLKTEQVQLPSLANLCHAPGKFDAAVVPAPQVTMWVLPSHQTEMGRACIALTETRSEWAQQSDQSRELKCGNQISTPLPVSWFRTRAVAGGGGLDSELSHCLPFPHSSKAVTDFTPHCHPESCHDARKPQTGRRASCFLFVVHWGL